jgi:hypothetical protein
MAGLFIAASALPVFKESKRWMETAKSILEREIEAQTYRSGINKELAFPYHIFTTEFFILAYCEALRSGTAFSENYKQYLKKMIEVIPILVDYGGNLPRYGDGDEGMAIQLQPLYRPRELWLYEIGISLLNCNVPVGNNPTLPAKILGIKQSKTNQYISASGGITFEDAGLYILARKRYTPHEIFVLADAGPLGYLSLAAHGHADALSFVLHIAGYPILIDPGTYCYHTEKHWRVYFRGTNAHNTVSIDNKDQSLQIGPFLWARKAKVSVDEFELNESGGKLTSHHDGYKNRGIIHKRTIELRENILNVVDNVNGPNKHMVYVNYHLHPYCEVESVGHNHVSIKRNNVSVIVSLSRELSVEKIYGGIDAGWYSPRFGKKEKTNTIRGVYNGILPITFKTSFSIDIKSDEDNLKRFMN